MKKALAIALLSSLLFATDYSSMSIDELSNLRNSVPIEERDAFRDAYREKVQGLSPEERNSFSRGSGNGNGQRLQDGSGSNNMYKGSRGGGYGRR